MANGDTRPMTEQDILDSWNKPLPTPPAAPPIPVKQNTGTLADIGTSLKRGVEEIPGMVTGALDIPSALVFGTRPFSTLATKAGEVTGFQPSKWADQAQARYSPEYQQAQKDIEEEWKNPTVSGVASAYARHPGYIASQVAESLPSMVLGGVGGRVISGGLARAVSEKMAIPVAAGVGEGAVQAGQQMQQGEGLADQRKNAIAALGSGVIDAIIGTGAGKLANKMGLETAETAIVKGFDKTVKSELSRGRRVVGGAVSEGILQELPQSAQEQVWQNYSEDKPLWDGVPRNAIEGALAGFVMGGAFNVRGEKIKAAIPTAQPEAIPTEQPDYTGMTQDMFTGEMRTPQWGPEYQSALDDAIQQTQPTSAQAEMFAPRQIGVGGTPLRFGVTTGVGGTKVLRGEKGKATVVPAAPEVSIPRITKRSDMISTIDSHLAEGRITPEQHDMLKSDATDTKVKLTKIRRDLEKAIAENAPQPTTIPKIPSVATEPVPEMPIDSTKLSQYEADMVKYLTSGIKPELLASVMRSQGVGGMAATSTRAAAKTSGVSHETERKRAAKGIEQLKANAEAAGVDWQTAQGLLGIAPEAPIESEVPEAGYEAGQRAAVAPSDEFQPTYGMDRTEETPGEIAAPTEEGAAQPEISPEDVLDAQLELDRAEQLMNQFTPEKTDLAAAAWGEGFNDLHPLSQIQFIAEVSDLISRGIGFDEFVREVERIKGERNAKIKQSGEPAFSPEIQSRAESIRGKPGEVAAGERAGEATTGAGRRPPVVSVKRRRVTGNRYSWDETKAKKEKTGEPKKTTGNTAQEISTKLKKSFVSSKKMDELVSIVDDESQLPNAMQGEMESAKGRVQGVYDHNTGRVWLVARNIPKGNELAVMLHEVGVHMGMKKFIGQQNYNALVSQVNNWVDSGTGIEGDLARRARGRIVVRELVEIRNALSEAEAEYGGRLPEDVRNRISEAAKYSKDVKDEETIAYFVEEAVIAGIDPTAISTQPKSLQEWFRKLMSAVRLALRRLGINADKLTAQNVVDLAYGAASLELRGEGSQTKVDGAAKMFSMAPTESMDIPKAVDWNKSVIAKAVKDQAKHIYDVTLDKAMFTEDLVKRAINRGLPSAKEFGDLMAEKMATRDLMEQDIANVMSRVADLSIEQKTAASDFIRKSTIEQKWGYKPAWDAEAVVDSSMEAEFKKLSPEAQSVVKDVFEFGNSTHVRLQNAVNQDINDEFDALLKTAENEAEKADIEKRRQAKIALAGKVMPKLDGPYAPLKRFGNHVVVAMSKEFSEAKKNGDKAMMEKLQTDEHHYLVEHVNTRAEALARVDQLKSYYSGPVDSWTKQEAYRQVAELPWSGIAKVKAAVEGLPEDSQTKRNMQNMLTDLYLTMMSETSARKSAELRRKGVAGANKDMFRSFASQGASTAHFITSLEHTGDINRALQKMHEDAIAGEAGTRHDRTSVLNELAARYAQSINYNQTPLVNRALKLTSFWMLLTSPSFYVQNAMQPFMISAPYMAGKFGARRTWGELINAYRDVGKYTLSSGAHQIDFNLDSLKLKPDEKAMLKELQKYGKLDLTLTQDIGRYTEGDSLLDKGPFGKVMRKLWEIPQHIELLNRITSALAAYRLATGNQEARTNYAGEVVSVTHGNYSAFNAPRFFSSSGAAKLITQFKKFQLIQLTLLAKIGHGVLKGATPEERAIARRTMYWLLGQQMVITGALGLPIPAVIWAVAAAAGSGEDEPDDYEQWLRNAIGDPDVANLLLQGVPAYYGLSMTQKVGMGGAFSPLPFAEIPKDRTGYEKFVTSVLGAPIAVGAQWFDALSKMEKGEYYKGVEAAMPSGIKNAMRGYRFATQGVTSGAGDILLPPEDVSFVDSFAQAMGLPTMKISERQRKQGVVLDTNKFYTERTDEIRRSYISAFKEKNSADMAAARDEWRQLQNARVANGFTRQPMSVLLRAPILQRRREQMAKGGIEFDKSNRRFVERLI